MMTWTPDLSLLKALIALNAGKTSVVLAPADDKVMAWAATQGYRVAAIADLCEIRPSDQVGVDRPIVLDS